ncbi:MAG: phosphoglucosamine mutase [Bacteroidia bacterium]
MQISVSGIRGLVGHELDPFAVLRYACGYAERVRRKYPHPVFLLGQDGRPSGYFLRQLVRNAWALQGIHVKDVGLTTTPTFEMLIPHLGAQGGILLTASHNPPPYNALKLFNAHGEFLAYEEIVSLADQVPSFASYDQLGSVEKIDGGVNFHVQSILQLPYVDTQAIKKAQFKVVYDGITSSGEIFVKALLEALGVQAIPLYGKADGSFPHPPEPLPENLTALQEKVLQTGAHVGIAVDPDVDRCAFVQEDGEFFGEEYSLVAIADYILQHQKGPVVTNLSTTQAVTWVAHHHGVPFYATKIGEYFVCQKMRQVQAVIGGEGNGGIILPALHYGRDALVAIALFLSFLAREKVTPSALRARYPRFYMAKEKLPLPQGIEKVLATLAAQYAHLVLDTQDGIKISWKDRWVHLRPSNTEPILRIYAEAPTSHQAHELVNEWKHHLQRIQNP